MQNDVFPMQIHRFPMQRHASRKQKHDFPMQKHPFPVQSALQNCGGRTPEIQLMFISSAFLVLSQYNFEVHFAQGKDAFA